MIMLTYLPVFIKVFFKGMPSVFRDRHQLIFCWLIVMQAVFPGRKTLKALSEHAPSHITDWRFRRLLKAGYWSVRVVLYWFADEVINSFPPPEDGIIYVVTDTSHKNKRGKKNPVAQKGRESEHHFWFFGILFVVLMVSWDVYRIIVDFRVVLPKDNPDYKKPNVLFQEMFQNFTPPPWAKTVITTADSGFASKENFKLIQKRDKDDHKRRWGFVFSIARTWNMQDGKSLSNLVKHLPYKYYKKTWIHRLPEGNRRKTFWIFEKHVCLNHIGDVTVVLSKKGRNVGPKKTKILVTNLTELTPRQVLSIYQRRWPVEILFKELKSGLGLGEHQVTREPDRIEKSIGIAIIAYLFLLRACRDDIRPGTSWSIFQLQNNFRLKVITNQVEHNVKLKLGKARKTA